MKDIERVRERAEQQEGIKVLGRNSGGYEMRWGGKEAREWLESVVDEYDVEFDNPARLEAGHAYVLILPSEEM